MDKFPLCWCGKHQGELMVEQEALYRRFSVRSRLPQPGIWCAWAIGERGELRLGVLEPCGEEAFLCRRFSERMTASLGRLLRGELRPVTVAERENWLPLQENAFCAPWLCRLLQHTTGGLTCMERDVQYLALPFDTRQPFPLLPIFCFAEIRRIHGRQYAVFSFDREEWPCFSKKGTDAAKK